MLLTVDNPFVTVQFRMRADISGVRGCNIGLSHSVGRANFAIHQRLQPLLFLCLGAVFVQHLHIPGIGSRAVKNFCRDVGLAHLLCQVGVLNGIEAGTRVAISEKEIPQTFCFCLVLQALANFCLPVGVLPAVSHINLSEKFTLQRHNFSVDKVFNFFQQRPDVITNSQIHV